MTQCVMRRCMENPTVVNCAEETKKTDEAYKKFQKKFLKKKLELTREQYKKCWFIGNAYNFKRVTIEGNNKIYRNLYKTLDISGWAIVRKQRKRKTTEKSPRCGLKKAKK